MSDFILVWVLMVFDPSHSSLSYSPPVKTLEDCQRMQQIKNDYSKWGDAKCVQVQILKRTH